MRDADIATTFRRRFYRQIGASVLIVIVGGAMAYVHKGGGRSMPLQPEWMVLWAAAVVGTLGFSFWNWRCPACSSYLGRGLFIRSCRQCGAHLKE